MQLSVPSKIRVAIYVFVVLGTAIIVPLYAGHVISDLFFAVWTSVTGAASGLAALNVKGEPVQ